MTLGIQYLLWSVGVYGFVFWLPTIIKSGSKQGIGNTGLLSAAPYALAVILMLVVSALSDRTARRIVFVWPALLIGAVAFYVSCVLGPGHFLISWILLIIAGGVMYAPYGPYFAIIPELLSRQVAGAAMALVNSLGALGGFAGAYVVGYLVGSGKEGSAFLLMAGCLVVAAGLMLLVNRPHAVPDVVRRPAVE